MNRRQILLLIIVFLVVVLISALVVYGILNKKPGANTKDSKTLTVGEYTLKYGRYKGFEEEYNTDTETVEKKAITVNLAKDKINDTFYEVRGMSLYVNGYEMYTVIANNKLRLLAGSGVELEYEGK